MTSNSLGSSVVAAARALRAGLNDHRRWLARVRRAAALAGAASLLTAFTQSATAQQADLQIAKTLTPTQYTVGVATNVTYTVTVTNNSATGTFVDKAPVVDIAPPGVTFNSWTCAITAAGTGATGTNNCWIGATSGTSLSGSGSIQPLVAGSLPPFPATVYGSAAFPITPNATTGVAVSLKPGATATFTINATIAANAYDLNPISVNGVADGWITNNAFEALPAGYAQETTNQQDVVLAFAFPSFVSDVGTTKAINIANYTPGTATAVVYSVTVTNFGPSPVFNAPFTDTAPANVTFGTWTCAITGVGSGAGTNACGAASGSGSPINTTVSLKNGAVATYTINATIGAGATGTICNSATATLPIGTSQTGNNQPDTSTACVNPAQVPVTINKTVTGAPATGAPGTYNFTITCATPTATYPATITLTGTATTGSTTVNVPAGSTNCVVTEPSVPTAPTNYSWGAPTIGTLPLTLVAGSTPSVGVTNPLTRNNVAVTITKTVTGAPATGAPGTYNFTIACSNPTATYTGSVTLTGTATT
ncbi:MAG: hypothetical protein JNL19_08590, partial [Burkholderiales bacterium]|nr:hypothetical protein [Burkholderiales bacterium]